MTAVEFIFKKFNTKSFYILKTNYVLYFEGITCKFFFGLYTWWEKGRERGDNKAPVWGGMFGLVWGYGKVWLEMLL